MSRTLKFRRRQPWPRTFRAVVGWYRRCRLSDERADFSPEEWSIIRTVGPYTITPPGEMDVDLFGKPAAIDFARYSDDGRTSVWARATLETVTAAVFSTGYPRHRFHFLKGRVEDMIPHAVPDRISLLRLNADWYSSMRHDLKHLFPRLVPLGVLIVDDYGHYEGCKRAVDEYFGGLGYPVFLSRMDYSARVAVKPNSVLN